MKTYYIGQVQYSSDDIFHYGRKGMKWGKNIFGDIAEGVKTDLFRNAQQQRGQAKYLFDVATNRKRSYYSPSGASNMAEAKRNYGSAWVPKPKNIAERFTGEHLKRSANMHKDWADDYRWMSEESSNMANNKHLGSSDDRYNVGNEGWRRQARSYASDAARNETQARLLDSEYEKAPRQVINRAVNTGKELIEDLVNDPSGVAKDVAENVGKAADKAGKAVSKASSDVSNWTSKAAKDVSKWGGEQVSKGQKWLDQAVKDVSSTADKASKSASKWVSNASKDVGKAASDATKAVNKAAKGASDWASNAAKDVGKAADKASKSASKWASNAASDVSKAANKAGKSASSWVSNATKDVGKAANKAGKSVSSWGSKAAKDVGSWGGNQLKKGKSFLKKIFG